MPVTAAAPKDLMPEQMAAVVAALRAGRREEAVERARRLLDDGYEHPLLRNLRAYWHEQSGRLADAMLDLDKARAAAGNDPVVLNAWGTCAAKLGNTEAAAEAFDLALSIAPGFAQAHLNRGRASEELGELDRARTHYDKAAVIEPGAAEAHASLAWLAARRADWADARRSAKLALSVDGSFGIAVLSLAWSFLGEGDPKTCEALLGGWLAKQQTASDDRAVGFGLLGDSLDRQDRTREAFEAYRRSNDFFHAIHADRFASPPTTADTVRWLTAYFREAPAVWRCEPAPAPSSAPCRAHVFLVGFPRSGTTLLEQVLACHPDAVTMDEREALADAAREYMRGPTDLNRLAAAGEGELSHWRERYWARVRQLGFTPDGRVVVDKLALNIIKIPIIRRLFPEAKVLFVRRDPRDVVWGCFRQRFRLNAAMYELLTLEGAATFYSDTMTLFDTYVAELRLSPAFACHEALVTDFEGETRRICDAIGITWCSDLKRFAERKSQRAISTPSATQVARGLYRDGIGQWERYGEQMERVLPILQRWVNRYGWNVNRTDPAH